MPDLETHDPYSIDFKQAPKPEDLDKLLHWSKQDLNGVIVETAGRIDKYEANRSAFLKSPETYPDGVFGEITRGLQLMHDDITNDKKWIIFMLKALEIKKAAELDLPIPTGRI